jgi:ATP phosphoribosyltransferase regulatory subunit
MSVRQPTWHAPWQPTWQLPDHLADVLPSQARQLEELRRLALDAARTYGYELVMPPLLEHIESLLTGTGQALDLQTFKLVDQLSGRMMGLRADTTPQVARIDAHLLNRVGVARLCYCGPVLHTQPAKPHATREPMQFGAEIFGHAGLEADLEILQLALASVKAFGIHKVQLDLADARIVRMLLTEVDVEPGNLAQIHAALAAKDASELRSLTKTFPIASREGLLALLQLFGDIEVLTEADKCLAGIPGMAKPLSELKQLTAALSAEASAGLSLSVDLADLRGYAYYSGARFGLYTPGASDALLRGGRYDEVGAVFGRNRPAVGFSLDMKALLEVLPLPTPSSAVRAPWGQSAALRAAVARLRSLGETVVCTLPGHEHEVNEFHCDRELIEVSGQWVVQSV